jgi:hypothetical protein
MAAMSLSERDLAAMRDIIHAAATRDPGRDGVGLPRPVLDALWQLVRCDEMCVSGQDWKVLGHYLATDVVDGAGPAPYEVAEPVPYDGWGPQHGFWGTFWTEVCSYPERTGDYASVTRLSDFKSDRELRAGRGYSENLGPRGYLHETMVVWPDGPVAPCACSSSAARAGTSTSGSGSSSSSCDPTCRPRTPGPGSSVTRGQT